MPACDTNSKLFLTFHVSLYPLLCLRPFLSIIFSPGVTSHLFPSLPSSLPPSNIHSTSLLSLHLPGAHILPPQPTVTVLTAGLCQAAVLAARVRHGERQGAEGTRLLVPHLLPPPGPPVAEPHLETRGRDIQISTRSSWVIMS